MSVCSECTQYQQHVRGDEGDVSAGTTAGRRGVLEGGLNHGTAFTVITTRTSLKVT
jgi:hypothetical protein